MSDAEVSDADVRHVRSHPARPGPPTTTQVDAHRHASRRLRAALVGRDPARPDPGRRQDRALAVGAVLAVLVAAAAAVVGVARGDTDWRTQTIVRGVPSGALAVVAHHPDRLVGVLDLTSARLLAGTPADAVAVRDDELAAAPRTPLAGIPGAPALLPGPGDGAGTWAVCDQVRLDPTRPDPVARPARATAVLGGLGPPGTTAPERALGPGDALLARGDDGAVWLVTDGRRARIDPTEGSVVRALGLTGARPRVAGSGFLGALPETLPLAPVVAPAAGRVPSVPSVRALGARVGAVVRSDGAGPPRLFLVLPAGVQELSPVAAQLARFANADPAADPGVVPVPAGLLAAAPHVAAGSGGVDVSSVPSALPRPVGYGEAPVVCVRPDPAGGPAAVTTAGGVPAATPPAPVDGVPGLDAARVAGAGSYVVPVGAPGALAATPAPPGPAPAGLLVDGVGRAFPVPTPAVADALGLGAPRPAPRAVVDLLPRGPVLDPAAARSAR